MWQSVLSCPPLSLSLSPSLFCPRLRKRLGDVPAFLVVDIGGFGARGFKEDGLFADAGIGGGEAGFGKNVEVGVFLEPWLEILRAEQVVRVVVHRGGVGPVKAGLEFVDREKAVGLPGGAAFFIGVEGGFD